MSSTYSRESAASALGLSEQACEQSPSVKSTPSAGPSSQSTGLTCLVTQTCELLPGAKSEQSMLFAEDSHARTSASPITAVLDWLESNPGYGESSPASFARFDPDTQSWKTYQYSVLGGLETFSETWPRAGMTRSGSAYQLVPLVPPISETESGFLPTPTATANQTAPSMQKHPGVRRLWSTPVADDTGHRKRRYSQGGEPLSFQAGGRLNPEWIEWLMGYPHKWTALEAWGTPSSRKSPKSSAAPSLKQKKGVSHD
jgi:hypothetical protein